MCEKSSVITFSDAPNGEGRVLVLCRRDVSRANVMGNFSYSSRPFGGGGSTSERRELLNDATLYYPSHDPTPSAIIEPRFRWPVFHPATSGEA